MFIHQPYGAFDFTGDRRDSSRPHGRAALPLDVFVVASSDPAVIMREYARITGTCRRCRRGGRSATCSRIARSRARRDRRHRAHDAREEAAVRRAHLPRHRVRAVGLEHAQRRVHLAPEELPRPESDARRAARSSTSRSSLHIVIEGQQLTGTVADPCTAPTAAERPHAGRQVAARSPGVVLLAVSQSRDGRSASTAGGPIRATASTDRRG